MNITAGDRFTDVNGITEVTVMYVNKTWYGVKIVGIGSEELFYEVKAKAFSKLRRLRK